MPKHKDAALKSTLRRQSGGSVSKKLAIMLEPPADAKQTIGALLRSFGPASIGFVLMIAALPAIAPVPGPFGMVFGTVLSLIAIQMMFGRARLWLPAVLDRYEAPPEVLRIIANTSLWTLTCLERISRKDRLKMLTGNFARSVMGILIFFLAILIVLPIPLGNILPVISILILAVSLIERDGLLAIVGLLVGIATIGLMFIVAHDVVSFLFY